MCVRTLEEIDEVARVLVQRREPRDDARMVVRSSQVATKARRQHWEVRGGDHVRTAEGPEQIAHDLALVEARIGTCGLVHFGPSVE